jgi:hypothetical protein
MLKRYNIHNSSGQPAQVLKGDKFGTFQGPRNQLEIDQMMLIPYAAAVGSIMYCQVCTRPDLAFVTGVLFIFQSNPRSKLWQAAKKALHYLQGTKHYKLTYNRIDNFEVIGYLDDDFVRCVDSQRSTSGYAFTLTSGAIAWRSSNQIIMTSFIMYTKFIACYEAMGRSYGLRILFPI